MDAKAIVNCAAQIRPCVTCQGENMKIEIKRLSPHQNGKVFGVLMAISSLIFVVPMAGIFSMLPTAADKSAPPAWLFLLFPIFYLIIGYITTAVACLIYNALYGVIGGIEYESAE
jgi:hypothetical protein